MGVGEAIVVLKSNSCFGTDYRVAWLFFLLLEKPIEQKIENIFQKSSFESDKKTKIIDKARSTRRKQKKFMSSSNSNMIADSLDGEGVRVSENFVETDSNGNSNMKDYNKYSLFNTALCSLSQLYLVLILLSLVLNI